MKRSFIYSKKSVRTLLLKLEPYFLSHAERGEPFQIQDFLGGIHLCRHFVPTPIRLPIPIFNFGGEGGTRTHKPVKAPVFKTGGLAIHRTSPIFWRKEWDSNPRAPFRGHGLANHCLGPLGHPSNSLFIVPKQGLLDKANTCV
jgi:hypothetical protein